MELTGVTSAKKKLPPRMLLYGQNGIGKSTFGSKAPSPIFVPTENGLGQIDCQTFPLSKSFQEFLQHLKDLRDSEHKFKSVVIDTLDWLEPLVWEVTSARWHVKHIEQVDKGYAKGYLYCLEEWNMILDVLDELREKRGMVIILLAHAKIEKVEEPGSKAYDRWTPRLNKHATALIVEWADAVLFAKYEMSMSSETLPFNKERNVAEPILAPGKMGSSRVLQCNGSVTVQAKNRYSLPDDIEFDYTKLVSLMKF